MNIRDTDRFFSAAELSYALKDDDDDDVRRFKESLPSHLQSNSLPVSSVYSSTSSTCDLPQKRPTIYSYLKTIRELAGSIVNHPQIQAAAIVCIILNAIMMGIATCPFVYTNPNTSKTFERSDLVFLIIFTVETGMQLLYHGVYLFLDGWLVFDFLIVLISWAFSTFSIFRSFRILRVLRLLNRVQNIRELVDALLSAMPRLIAMAGLLGLIFYIFAVMFTHLFKDLPLQEPYFVSLSASLFTLFQVMSLDWAGTARECMAYYPWAWVPFVTFIIISSFIAFNLIIAVICDAVGAITSRSDADDTEISTCDMPSVKKEVKPVKKEFNFLEMERKLHALSAQVQEMTQAQEQLEYTIQQIIKLASSEQKVTTLYG
jgi:hypothetical protein